MPCIHCVHLASFGALRLKGDFCGNESNLPMCARNELPPGGTIPSSVGGGASGFRRSFSTVCCPGSREENRCLTRER